MTAKLVVRRSAVRMWLMALGSVPLVVLGLDVVGRRRITDALRELLFRPDDTQLLEPRDVVWAVVMLAVGAGLAVWSLKELLFPTVVLRADPEGVRLKLGGPFRPPVHLSWDDVDDVGADVLDDEGTRQPILWIRPMNPGSLPADPWGARWVDQKTLGIFASDWELPPDRVASQMVDIAVASARASREDA
jgi:hypothetical protein